MAKAAVEFARGRGAGAIEGYPITINNMIAEGLHVGIETTFLAAGFTGVTDPPSEGS